MEKGVSTTIAVVLLVMIVVALIAFLWLFANNLFNTVASSGKTSIENFGHKAGGCLLIENVNPRTGVVTVRNCGNIPLNNLIAFVDNSMNASDNNVLYSGSIDNFMVGLTAGKHDIFVTSDNAQSLHTQVEVPDFGQPQWFDSYINSTLAGSPVLHSLRWTSNVGLSGYIFSFDNCTDSFANESWTNNGGSFGGAQAFSNVTETTSSTVGCTIHWKIYANDTSNNWNVSTNSYIVSSGGGSGCGNSVCYSGENQTNCPQDCGYPPSYCDYHIPSLTDTYTIDQSNKVYCLDNSYHIDNKDAIDFASGVQNTTLDCQGYNLDGNEGRYAPLPWAEVHGVYLNENDNNLIKNCTITHFDSGVYTYYSSNNTIMNSLINNNFNGIKFSYTSNNNTVMNSLINNNHFGLTIDSSYNNVIIDGSVSESSQEDYEIWSAGTTNYFINTNFNDYRTIFIYDSGDGTSFNYNNETSGNIWLKTGAPSGPEIQRKLINWSQTLMVWNDSSTISTNVYYKITGLLQNTNYNIYKNSVLISGSPLNSDSNGQMNFTIVLPPRQETEIKVVMSTVPQWFERSINSSAPGKPTEFRMKWISNAGLSRYIFSLDNCTGNLQNISSGIISGTTNWTNITYTINSTLGCTMRWKVYANDTNNTWGVSPTFSFYTDLCDFHIQDLPDTYIIDQSNKLYCLLNDANIDGKDAIDFASGVQNTTLDCQGYNIDGNGGSNGVYLTGSGTKNNTINNCNVTNFLNGIYVYNGPINNIIKNNTADIYVDTSNNVTITNNIVIRSNGNGGINVDYSSNSIINNNIVNSRSYYGILVGDGSNNVVNNNVVNGSSFNIWITAISNSTINNNIAVNGAGTGIYLYQSSNNVLVNNTAYGNRDGIGFGSSWSNNVTGGSIFNNTNDYYCSGGTNNITNTNFTDVRTFDFIILDKCGFNYNNETTGNVWLNTTPNQGTYSESKIKRKLSSWSNTRIEWNDTCTYAQTSVTAAYDITGLLIGSNYNIYNNSVFVQTLNSGPNGKISFTIGLTPINQGHNITVQKV